jgi:hypothetical protein
VAAAVGHLVTHPFEQADEPQPRGNPTMIAADCNPHEMLPGENARPVLMPPTERRPSVSFGQAG